MVPVTAEIALVTVAIVEIVALEIYLNVAVVVY